MTDESIGKLMEQLYKLDHDWTAEHKGQAYNPFMEVEDLIQRQLAEEGKRYQWVGRKVSAVVLK